MHVLHVYCMCPLCAYSVPTLCLPCAYSPTTHLPVDEERRAQHHRQPHADEYEVPLHRTRRPLTC